MIRADIRRRKIDFIQVQQSEQFTKLAANQVFVQRAFDTLQSQYEKLQHTLQSHIDETLEARNREKFLNGPFDRDLDVRKGDIKSPASGTLDWIFETRDEEGDEVSYRLPWHGFGPWLEGDKPIYWICGKAGSGKSTLMAHLVDDRRTTENLERWSQSRCLHIISFFFWRAGSKLQNSTAGLLRSLLYQICQAAPYSTIARVLKSLSLEVNRIPAWSEARLLAAIQVAVSSTSSTCYCFFIDGLDEYTGCYDHLTNLVLNLKGSKNAKCCVSSRPEVQIGKKMEGYSKLFLSELNYNDISNFVRQILDEADIQAKMKKRLVKYIVSHAHGVFLWASLVTRKVKLGSIYGDSEALLWDHARSAPPDLNGLFEKMVNDVDDVHKESLAFFLQCAHITEYEIRVAVVQPFRSICALTAIRNEGEILSLERFILDCEKTETQVLAHSAGLLEVLNIDPRRLKRNSMFSWYRKTSQQWDGNCDMCECPRARFSCPSSNLEASPSETNPSCVCFRRGIDIDRYDTHGIAWIHRSAYDFVTESSALAPIREKF